MRCERDDVRGDVTQALPALGPPRLTRLGHGDGAKSARPFKPPAVRVGEGEVDELVGAHGLAHVSQAEGKRAHGGGESARQSCPKLPPPCPPPHPPVTD